jgi:integrase
LNPFSLADKGGSMTLYQVIDAALTCQQQRADGTFTPLLARSRRAPMRSAAKRYAEMLGLDAATADPKDYHRPDHEVRTLIATKAPRTLAAQTVRNCTNDVLTLFRLGVEQGWIDPLPAPLLSWRPGRGQLRGNAVPRGEQGFIPRYRLEASACPPALQEELTAYLRWCEAPIARGRDRRIAKRPQTSHNVRTSIMRLAGFATATLHMPVADLTLHSLCQPDVIEALINWWLTEHRGRMTRGLHHYLVNVITLVKHWLKDATLAKTLEAMVRSLPPIETVRDKQARWLSLAQLEEVGLSLHPLNARHLQDYPHIPRYRRGPASQCRFAFYVGMSLILRLLIRLPMRQRNIRIMEMGKHLYQDRAGLWHIRFVGRDLKVAMRRGVINEYAHPFPPDLVDLLQEWWQDWRPKVATADSGDYVFVNSHGKPFAFADPNKLSDPMQRLTYRFTGVGVTPHIIRDIWATEYLEQFPGDIAGAARRLGNTEAMVLKHYAHILERDVDARAETFLRRTFAPDTRTSR